MAINEPGIGELRQKTDSTYTLAIQAAKRARQLMEGQIPLVEEDEKKPLTIAIEEINRGLLTYHRSLEDEQ